MSVQLTAPEALLAAPAPPPRRRGPILIGLALVAGLLAGTLGVGAAMILAVAPVVPGLHCDPVLRAAPPAAPAGLTVEQVQTARRIVDTGRRLGVPSRGLVVALATAMTESRLRPLAGGDRDSAGAFQQRPSQGWGTRSQVVDVGYAAEQFYRHLLVVPSWVDLPVTVAAQAVQRSALPNAYARWEGLAATLVASLGQVADVSGCVAAPPDPAPDAGSGAQALAWARGRLGAPYRWGATGPDAFDCSGLVLRAYGAAGITLPRTSRDQFRAGRQVARSAAVAGDLLFWASSPRDPATIYHVALYVGGGQVLEAPHPGAQVRVRALGEADRDLLPNAVRPAAT